MLNLENLLIALGGFVLGAIVGFQRAIMPFKALLLLTKSTVRGIANLWPHLAESSLPPEPFSERSTYFGESRRAVDRFPPERTTTGRRRKRSKNSQIQIKVALISAAALIIAAIIGEFTGFYALIRGNKSEQSVPGGSAIISLGDSSTFFVSARGRRKMYGTEGNYYKLNLSGRLSILLKDGNLLFPVEEFTLSNVLDYRPRGADVPAWDQVITRLNEAVRLYPSKNYYLFIEGFADSAIVPNDQFFSTIGNVSVANYLQGNPIANALLSRPLFYLEPLSATSRNEFHAVRTPYMFNPAGFANQDLPLLRADFVRKTFNENTIAELAYPVGVIRGAVIDKRDEHYRTVALYLYETDDDLEKAMERVGVDFSTYFLD